MFKVLWDLLFRTIGLGFRVCRTMTSDLWLEVEGLRGFCVGHALAHFACGRSLGRAQGVKML